MIIIHLTMDTTVGIVLGEGQWWVLMIYNQSDAIPSDATVGIGLCMVIPKVGHVKQDTKPMMALLTDTTVG